VQDAGIARGVAAGDGQEGAGAELFQLGLVEKSGAHAVSLRKELDGFAIRAHR
jgi:hypothetical protein